jgi:hypothetical protein
MPLGSTHPLTRIGIFLGVKSGRRIWLAALPPSMSRMSENVGASTSHNPKDYHGLYRDDFTFYHYIYNYGQIKEDEIGKTYSTHGEDEKCIHNFSRKP